MRTPQPPLSQGDRVLLACLPGTLCDGRAFAPLIAALRARKLSVRGVTIDTAAANTAAEVARAARDRVIPEIGRVVTGDAESYRYLVESIRQFPKPAAFSEMISAAGFSRVSAQILSGGIVALHSGWRL